MKSLTTYITEKMVYTKATASKYNYYPKTKEELKDIIDKLIDEQSMEDIIDLNSIDTSEITDMSGLFYNFEGILKIDVSKWDVSNVKTMDYMFKGCINLEKIAGIEDWKVSNVESMQDMFRNCESFNQYIFNWDVSKVENMDFMFDGCKSFNQDISKWNVSNVTDRNWIFNDCPIEQKYKPKFK